MSHDELKMARRKAVGTKQTIKALERGEAKTVYLAKMMRKLQEAY